MGVLQGSSLGPGFRSLGIGNRITNMGFPQGSSLGPELRSMGIELESPTLDFSKFHQWDRILPKWKMEAGLPFNEKEAP